MDVGSTEWHEVGSALNGEMPGDFTGLSLSLSGDGLTLAISTPRGLASGSGLVDVYRLS